MEENKFLMNKIKRYFIVTETAELACIIFSLIVLGPLSIFFMLNMIASATRRKKIILCVLVEHVIFPLLLIGLLLFENSLYQGYRNFGDDFSEGVYIVLIIINILLSAIYLGAYSYAKDEEQLKTMDGYPYFNTHEIDRQENARKSLYNYSTVKSEKETIEEVIIPDEINLKDNVKNKSTEMDSV